MRVPVQAVSQGTLTLPELCSQARVGQALRSTHWHETIVARVVKVSPGSIKYEGEIAPGRKFSEDMTVDPRRLYSRHWVLFE